MKKTLCAAAILFTSLLYAEAPLQKGWIPTRTDLHSDKNIREYREDSVTLRGFGTADWNLYRPEDPIHATLHDKAEVTFTASGKGSVKVGFLAYSQGWSAAGWMLREFKATDEKKSECWTFDIPARAKLIRPFVVVMPGSEVTFYEHSVRLLPWANPQIDVSAERVTGPAVLHPGETSGFSVTVKAGKEPVKAGNIAIRFRHDGVEKEKRVFDLAEKNPITVDFTLDHPGFVELRCDITGVPGQKDKKDIQLVASGFDPEKLKAGAPAPADLLTYWRGEYETFCREVPPDFQRTVVKEDSQFTQIKLTCANRGGTRTYASLTIPKGKGPFPMRFNVPPAGHTVYNYIRTPGVITLCVSVHDTEAYNIASAYNADMKENGWYFYRTGEKRESFYYYKSILGVMRMMDYAMKNVPEWDGVRLAAGGQSQGGGFSLIMAALNPKIKAVFADIPALCDHNAGLAGRTPGWPQLLKNPKGKLLGSENAAYYDAASFAAFVECPAVVAVGFIDTMCYPASVYAAFNNLKGPKKIINCPTYGHGWGTRGPEFNEAVSALLKEAFRKQEISADLKK